MCKYCKSSEKKLVEGVGFNGEESRKEYGGRGTTMSYLVKFNGEWRMVTRSVFVKTDGETLNDGTAYSPVLHFCPWCGEALD